MVKKQKTYIINNVEYKAPDRVYRVATGWQVRFDRKNEKHYSRLFADKKYPSTKDALAAAKKHAKKVEVNYKNSSIFIVSTPKLLWKKNSNNKEPELNIGVSLPWAVSPKKSKMHWFNAGSFSTLTEESLASTFEYAYALSLWMKAKVDEVGLDKASMLKHPDIETLSKHLPEKKDISYPNFNSIKQDAQRKHVILDNNTLQTNKSLEGLIETFKLYNISSMRRFEVLFYLREPRTISDIEAGLNMQGPEINKFFKRMPDLIKKTHLEQSGRGKPPTIYSLTTFGQEAIADIAKILK